MFRPLIVQASACWLRREGARPRLEEGANGLLRPLGVRLQVASDIRLLDLLDDSGVGQVDRVVAELHPVLLLLAVQQEVHLLGRVVVQPFVVVEKARRRVRSDFPRRPERHLDGAPVERLRQVQEALRRHAQLVAKPVARRAHPQGIVEGEGVGEANVRLPDAGEEQPRQRGDVGDRPHRGVRPAAEALLVDDDGHAQVLDGIGIGLWVAWQEAADEHRKVLEQLPLRLAGDGVVHDRRLAGA
jgi:hypothetical protein